MVVGGRHSENASYSYDSILLASCCVLIFSTGVQEHTPMTEDMLWEQATVLAKLGTSEEAARVRAKMQSSSLLSDMQAFKASTYNMHKLSTFLCCIAN